MPQPQFTDMPLGHLGNIEVSKYQTATGSRLRLRRHTPRPAEVYLDPLELEGLTRVRYKPIALLPPRSEQTDEATPRTDGTMEPLQNEFALVSVGVAHVGSEEALLIRDMNAGQAVLLRAHELDALLRARHRDFAPLVDTSDLVAIPEADIDQA
ncbi:MAG: hypothetical protein E6H05_12695 [Bacillati bacterium ANGP1]|uniref:Uncharacterized protein n=1 Tax=Candidatus Segetimicrobium genomatis TaxID=2569760 RepID=A0A537IJ54_9BACT|nr:MAG: hypothetical protein E6H05_12695 [Terrabacteria group bacterium ANGP1]